MQIAMRPVRFIAFVKYRILHTVAPPSINHATLYSLHVYHTGQEEDEAN